MRQIGITDFGDGLVRNKLRNPNKTGKVGGVILFEKNLQKEDRKAALKQRRMKQYNEFNRNRTLWRKKNPGKPDPKRPR